MSVQPASPVSQRSARASALIAKIVNADEQLDASAFVEVLTPTAPFRFASAPPIVDHNNIRAMVSALFSAISGLQHTIHGSWEGADTLVYEGEVRYTFDDGSDATLPYVNVLRLAGDLVADYRIYIDPAPLMSTPLASVLARHT